MWSLFLSFLEELGIGLLGVFFQTLSKDAKATGIDSAAIDYVNQLVQSADSNTALATPADKLSWVAGQAESYFKSRWPTVSTSLVNSVIQLAVHHQHATPTPAK